MTVLTPEVQDVVLANIRRGAPESTAAQAAGITVETIRRWKLVAEGAEHWPGTESPVTDEARRSAVRFVEQLAQAKAATRQVLTSSLYHNATTPNAKTGWYDTQAIDKLLSKSPDHREDWYENRQLQVTQQGTVSHEHRLVEGMSEPEILASVDAEWRELAAPPVLPVPREGETG